ncbi:efflux RND transporter periplasmic adaptor subunit [Elioraea tepida]|uniref:Efflux RND transporter periplasmic adaptor subunit n=1 Tax=Elioraea tepida TaxID=2843330 RepID=A0A975TZT7_9PROT|nr:efflux RND transporter periplasmic adaptor subunit [Elioraea tepida]QXM23656.1 efflux RND transporter periplasmic adaptor subunit [Elioraea tepida]
MRALALLLVLLSLPAQAQEIVRGPTRPQALAALAPQVDGVVRHVAVAEGERVRKGDLLLALDDALQQARIALAEAAAANEAELRQARVTLAEASAVLERTAAAAGRGAAGEWEVRQARARVELARAGVESAEEKRRLEARRLDVERAAAEQLLVRAPFDGIVTRLDVVAGATVSRADRLVTVADLSVLEAVLFLPASVWPRLRLGGTYTLDLAAPVDRPVEAVLRSVDPVLDAASGRFRAVFTIANPDLALPAGMEAALDLGALGR